MGQTLRTDDSVLAEKKWRNRPFFELKKARFKDISMPTFYEIRVLDTTLLVRFFNSNSFSAGRAKHFLLSLKKSIFLNFKHLQEHRHFFWRYALPFRVIGDVFKFVFYIQKLLWQTDIFNFAKLNEIIAFIFEIQS